MKLKIETLKQESYNFDLECVFILDLSNKGIKDLDHIKDCINLEILNLSLNEISDLRNLKGLNKLQFINLSLNNIKHLDGLESLESLKTLNLSGNKIENIEEFFKLRNLENLTNLIINDSKSIATNPICSKNKNYKNEIRKILTKLESIDGENLKLNSNITLNIKEDSMDQYKNTSDDLELNLCSEPWFNSSHLSILNEEKNMNLYKNSVDEEKEKFKKAYEEISKKIAISNQMTFKIENSFGSLNIDKN